MAKGLHVVISGDARGLSRAYGQATGQTQKFGKAMGTTKLAALGLGGAVGTGLAMALRTGWMEFAEGEKAAAQTNAVLKSTGSVANVTAKDVAALAASLQKKSGIDDEAIQAGENMLLTFRGVRNEVGKGNKIFDQATAATLDMSVALGKDMTSSALMVGKALQDPILGLTALRRAGVTFTAAQREQIKAMVAAGDTMGAQKMILAELNAEFGGSAKALGDTIPGQVEKAKRAFEELTGNLVAMAIPAILQLAPAFQTMGSVIGAVAPAIGNVVKMMFESLAAPMRVFLALIRGEWGQAWEALKAPAEAAIGVVKAIVTPLAPFVSGVWDAIRSATEAAWGSIKAITDTTWNAIKTVTTTVWNAIKTAVTSVLTALSTAVTSYFDAYKLIVTTAWNAIRTLTTTVWNAVRTAVSTAINAVETVIKTSVAAARTAVSTAWNAIQALTSSVWNAIKTAVSTAINAAESVVKTSVAAARAAVGSAWDAAKSMTNAAWSAMERIVSKSIGDILALVRSIPGRIVSALGDLSGVLYGAGQAIISGFISGMISKLEAAYSVARGIAGKIASIKGPIQDDLKLLVPHGRAIIQGLTTGISDQFDTKLAPLLGGFGARIQQLIGQTPGGDPLAGFSASLDRSIETIKRTFGGIEEAAKPATAALATFANPSFTLGAVTTNATSEMVEGLGDLPDKIVASLGDLRGLLYEAGQTAMEGLAAGITSKLDAVKSALAEVRSLFLPEFTLPAVAGATARVGGNVASANQAPTTRAVPGMDGAMAGGMTVNLNVNVGTMIGDDKRRVAEDLAADMDRALAARGLRVGRTQLSTGY